MEILKAGTNLLFHFKPLTVCPTAMFLYLLRRSNLYREVNRIANNYEHALTNLFSHDSRKTNNLGYLKKSVALTEGKFSNSKIIKPKRMTKILIIQYSQSLQFISF